MLFDLLGEAIHGECPVCVQYDGTCFSASGGSWTYSNGDQIVEEMRLASSASSRGQFYHRLRRVAFRHCGFACCDSSYQAIELWEAEVGRYSVILFAKR